MTLQLWCVEDTTAGAAPVVTSMPGTRFCGCCHRSYHREELPHPFLESTLHTGASLGPVPGLAPGGCEGQSPASRLFEVEVVIAPHQGS